MGSCADSGAGTRPMGAAQGAAGLRALKGEWPVYSSSSWKWWDIMEMPGPTPGLIAHDFLLHNTKSHFSSRSSYSQDDSKIHRAKPAVACLPTPLFFNPKQVLKILDVMNRPGGGSVCSRDTPTSPLVTAPHAGSEGIVVHTACWRTQPRNSPLLVACWPCWESLCDLVSVRLFPCLAGAL